MSDVELVREFWGLWRTGGLAELGARFDEFFTDDLVWRSPVAEMKGGSFVGREGFERHVADLEEIFDEIGAVVEQITEIAPDVILSRVRIHGRGSTSGAAIDSPLVSLGRMRDGRMCWVWSSFDVEAGERAANAVVRGEELPV